MTSTTKKTKKMTARSMGFEMTRAMGAIESLETAMGNLEELGMDTSTLIAQASIIANRINTAIANGIAGTRAELERLEDEWGWFQNGSQIIAAIGK